MYSNLLMENALQKKNFLKVSKMPWLKESKSMKIMLLDKKRRKRLKKLFKKC